MTVKDCILAAGAELGIKEGLEAYFNGSSQDKEAEAEALLRCFNLVENELALDYLPLTAEESVATETGSVFYSDLKRAAVRILEVRDKWGNEVEFKLYPEYLKTQPGEWNIRYSYTPAEKGMDGESDFVLLASVRMFAYGMAAEYSLAAGLFEEAAVWDKKYKDAIAATYRSHGSKRIRLRRWV